MYEEAFIIGLDEGVFSCTDCGSLVLYSKIPDHTAFHTRVNYILDVARGSEDA